MADLRNRSWVLNPDGCGFGHSLARSLAAIDEHLHVQFELDAAPQEHIAMVAAGVGYSIVPASALSQSAARNPGVRQLTASGFAFDLVASVVWNERCQLPPGTREALAAIFEPPALGPRVQRPKIKSS
jgi:DNA-binding transcriptional LysR family regulator